MKKVVLGLAAAVALLAAATGGYAIGRSTRPSERAARLNAAVGQRATRAKREQDAAVRAAVARTQRADADAEGAALATAKRARKTGYDAGYKAGREDGHADASSDTSSVDGSSSAADEQPRNTVTTPDGTWDRDSAAYRARCRDLYDEWKAGEDDGTDSGDEAIQEYGDMLCDQS